MNRCNIAAGIVTYNPDIKRLKENVDAICKQVNHIIILDNASNNIEEIEKEFAENFMIYIIKNEQNKGIAAALNQIMHHAVNQGMEWTLTLDQDSVSPSNMIEEYQKYLEYEKLAMIVPIIRDRAMDLIDIREEMENMPYTYVKNAITSGTLMNNAIWEELGKFEEKLFIDYVDFDYCRRIEIAGYKILRTNQVILLHELGNATQIKFIAWLGNLLKSKKVLSMQYTSNHSPLRLYYVTRNQLYYIKKYKAYLNVKKELRGIIIGIIMKLMFEKQRWKKAKAVLKAIKDSKKL